MGKDDDAGEKEDDEGATEADVLCAPASLLEDDDEGPTPVLKGP